MVDSPKERYEEIQRMLQEAVLRDYPNPERKGCPGADVLRRMAAPPTPVRNEQWEHVTHCSPCYRDFLKYRAEVLKREDRNRLIRRRSLIAAAVFIVACVSAYLMIHDHYRLVAERQQPPIVADNRGLPSAVLNLENESEQRGNETRRVGEIQRLPQKRMSLFVYLPFGSEAGDYEVRLLNRDEDTAPIATYKGEARIENGLTVLRLVVDLSSVPSGPYVLATRRGKQAWRYSRFVVG